MSALPLSELVEPTIRPGRVHHQDPPARVQRFLANYGGKNRYGGPMYRLVWGGSRLSWKAGEWNDHDEHGELIRTVIECRQTPKYFWARERFVLESWRPPETFGTPAEWYARAEWIGGQKVDLLGDYPREGDYGPIDVVEDIVLRCTRLNIHGPNKPCDSCTGESVYLEPTRLYVKHMVDLHRKQQAMKAKDVYTKDIAEIGRKRTETWNYHYDQVHDNAPSWVTPYVSYAGLDAKKGILAS